MILTGGKDKSMKLWNIKRRPDASDSPLLVELAALS
jgi:hypothetical protein